MHITEPHGVMALEMVPCRYLDVACKTAACNLDVPMLDWLAGSQFMESEDALECCCGAIQHMGEQPPWMSDPLAK